jgi:hypothetical protein
LPASPPDSQLAELDVVADGGKDDESPGARFVFVTSKRVRTDSGRCWTSSCPMPSRTSAFVSPRHPTRGWS